MPAHETATIFTISNELPFIFHVHSITPIRPNPWRIHIYNLDERQFVGYSKYRSRLVDGHVHTELCPHGSGDRTAMMIEKAIELRIEKVCLTEHAPLPTAFAAEYGGDKKAYDTASLKLNEVDTYLELGRQLQRAYGTHIDISLGFEVDYIPGFESDIQEFLDRYGPLTDDNILSVHFMEGVNNAFYCLDYSAEEFEKGFGPWIEKQYELYYKYYSTVLIKSKCPIRLGVYSPRSARTAWRTVE